MAIKRTSSNSLVNATKMSTGFSSAAIPNSPTIGSATAISDVAATVAYTAAVLGANGVTFTATSSPSSITGTGSSPITVTGLTASTSYTFSVTAGNANGTSAASSASNSITTSDLPTSYESIATVTVGSGGSSTVSFTSIPQTYKHLQIRAFARNTSTGNDVFSLLRFNGSSASAYATHYLIGTGSATASGFNGPSVTDMFSIVTWGSGSSMNSNVFSAGIIDILDYTSTTKNKTVRTLTGVDGNGMGQIDLTSGLWLASPVAVTQIDLLVQSNNYAEYSSFALYGIKGA